MKCLRTRDFTVHIQDDHKGETLNQRNKQQAVILLKKLVEVKEKSKGLDETHHSYICKVKAVTLDSFHRAI